MAGMSHIFRHAICLPSLSVNRTCTPDFCVRGHFARSVLERNWCVPVQSPQQRLPAAWIFEDMCHSVQLATHLRSVVKAKYLTDAAQQSCILEFLYRLVNCRRIRERYLADILLVYLVLHRVLL